MELVPSPPIQSGSSRVDLIIDEVKKLFYKPDLEAFRILLCAIVSHTLEPHGYLPTWILVIGPSGSGKTDMVKCFDRIPTNHRINDITPKTFLSGFERKGRQSSLLHRIGTSGFLTMKDFTSVLSMRHENKAEVFAQLREIHDGRWCRNTGLGHIPAWEGRITVVACCTPQVDRDLMTFRLMGDRFTPVRWNGATALESARRVAQRPKALDYTLIQEMLRTFVIYPFKCPTISEEQIEQLILISCFVAQLRTPLQRDERGHDIQDIYSTEYPTRIVQALESVVLASAAIDESPCVRHSDMHLARRLAFDSVPPHRLSVVRALGTTGFSKNEESYLGLSRYTRDRAIDDLLALDIIDEDVSRVPEYAYTAHWKFTPAILETL